MEGCRWSDEVSLTKAIAYWGCGWSYIQGIFHCWVSSRATSSDTVNIGSPSVQRDDVEDRYCAKFLNIETTNSAIKAHDDPIIAKTYEDQNVAVHLKGTATSRYPKDNGSVQCGAATTDNLGTSQVDPLPYRMKVLEHHVARIQGSESKPVHPETNSWFESSRSSDVASPTLPILAAQNCSSSERPRANPHKRIRPNSMDSTHSYYGHFPGTPNTYTNFSRPQVQKLREQLRDSGFYSMSSESDTNSLVSRLDRLSLEFKVCEGDHSPTQEGCCPFCSFPEVQPKPRLYLAPEHALSHYGDEVVKVENLGNEYMSILTESGNH